MFFPSLETLDSYTYVVSSGYFACGREQGPFSGSRNFVCNGSKKGIGMYHMYVHVQTSTWLSNKVGNVRGFKTSVRSILRLAVPNRPVVRAKPVMLKLEN